jgi:2'-5' RNA ligase
MTTSPAADEITEDWRSFAALDRLGNHWDRPGWTPGRRSYHWMLTFEDATGLHDLARRCQEQLRLPVLDPVPLDGLHLTLQRVAFTDQISAADLDAVTDTAIHQLAGHTPFTLTVGPIAGSPGAVRFSVRPWEPVVRLREALLDAITLVLGPAAVSTSAFRPHVGIAYCNQPTDAEPVISAVAPLRALPPAHVTIATASLVELRRDDRTYRWETVTQLRLAQEGSPDR